MCIGEQKILPVNDEGLNTAFSSVIAQFQTSVPEIIEKVQFSVNIDKAILFRFVLYVNKVLCIKKILDSYI